MSRHESNVNFRRLIKDLAEMYPYPVAEVVVVELVANALDAGAREIRINFDPRESVLAIEDDGKGMSASEFKQYHDFAAGLKRKGDGIGFAGVGAKISFNIAERVITEVRGESFSGGSDWGWATTTRLVWEDRVPRMLAHQGTRVEVRFKRGSEIPYQTEAQLISLLRRHYLPLFDTKFLALYQQLGVYDRRLRFFVNNTEVAPVDFRQEYQLQNVREVFPRWRGKRLGYGLFGLAGTEYPVGEGLAGVLLCTRGKVVKGDWLGQFPGELGPRVFAVVEMPRLARFLTTAKTDFARSAGRHRQLEQHLGPVREQFRVWLKDVGARPIEASKTTDAARLARELKRLMDVVPELREYFGFSSPAKVLRERSDGEVPATPEEGAAATFPKGKIAPVDAGLGQGSVLIEAPDQPRTRAEPISRKSRIGPRVGFAEAPDREELAWVDGVQITINSAHPAYKKAERISKRALTLHHRFSIAVAIQRLVAEGGEGDRTFLDRLVGLWSDTCG